MKRYRVFSGLIEPDDDVAGNVPPQHYRAGDIAPFAVVAMCLVALALGGWLAISQSDSHGGSAVPQGSSAPDSDIPQAPPFLTEDRECQIT
jgi:hypothetical protein